MALGRHRRAETYRDGVRNFARRLPEEAAALVAEDAAPNAVEIYGHDRRVHIFHNAFHAAAERQQLADARDLAFSKNADYFAVAYGVAGFAQGMDHVARAQLRRNGDGANHFGEGLDVRLVVDVLEHEEADGAVR